MHSRAFPSSAVVETSNSRDCTYSRHSCRVAQPGQPTFFPLTLSKHCLLRDRTCSVPRNKVSGTKHQLETASTLSHPLKLGPRCPRPLPSSWRFAPWTGGGGRLEGTGNRGFDEDWFKCPLKKGKKET